MAKVKVNVLDLILPAQSEWISYFIRKKDGCVLEEYDYYREPLEVQKECIQVPLLTAEEHCQFATNYLKDNPKVMKKWQKNFGTSEVDLFNKFCFVIGEDKFYSSYLPYEACQIKEKLKEWCLQNQFDVIEETKDNEEEDLVIYLKPSKKTPEERKRAKKRDKFYKDVGIPICSLNQFCLGEHHIHEEPGVRICKLDLVRFNQGIIVHDVRKYLIKELSLYVVGDKYAACELEVLEDGTVKNNYYEYNSLKEMPKKFYDIFKNEKFKRFVPKKEIIDPNSI